MGFVEHDAKQALNMLGAKTKKLQKLEILGEEMKFRQLLFIHFIFSRFSFKSPLKKVVDIERLKELVSIGC